MSTTSIALLPDLDHREPDDRVVEPAPTFDELLVGAVTRARDLPRPNVAHVSATPTLRERLSAFWVRYFRQPLVTDGEPSWYVSRLDRLDGVGA